MPATPPPIGANHAAKRTQALADVEQRQPLFRPVLTALSNGSKTAKEISSAVGAREREVVAQLAALCKKEYATVLSRNGGKPTHGITSAGSIQLQLHETFLPQAPQTSTGGEIEF